MKKSLKTSQSKKPRRILKSDERNDFNKKIGDYIREKREEAKLTQTQLADKLYDGQMEPKGVWKIENGLYTPNLYVIAEIAKVFNLSLSEFLKDFKY
ncbi:MAG: helix-turn-helix domain-containing protein [Flavobacteriales bacterium]